MFYLYITPTHSGYKLWMNRFVEVQPVTNVEKQGSNEISMYYHTVQQKNLQHYAPDLSVLQCMHIYQDVLQSFSTLLEK